MVRYSDTEITYGCACGVSAPVSTLFYCSHCHKLTCRAQTCSAQEFESYYCSNLLTNLPSKEASMYHNRSSRCFECATCKCVLTTTYDESIQKYYFVCPHCRWDSYSTIGLVENDPDVLLMLTVARERESLHEHIYNALLSFHTRDNILTPNCGIQGTKQYSKICSYPSGDILDAPATILGVGKAELNHTLDRRELKKQRLFDIGEWKLEQRLEKDEERLKCIEEQRKNNDWAELTNEITALEACNSNDNQVRKRHDSTHESDEDVELDGIVRELSQICDISTVASLEQRTRMPLEQQYIQSKLYPIRPSLRIKRTWRCVECMKKGEAGILIKPQISPMSGDSSLPVPGSWFKKASLAVHNVPIITIAKLPSIRTCAGDDSYNTFSIELLFENPLEEWMYMKIEIRVDDGEGKSPQLDRTPFYIGPYEDPAISEAFHTDDESNFASRPKNKMLVKNIRNTVWIRHEVSLEKNAQLFKSKLWIEIMRCDAETEQEIIDSKLEFPVELIAPIDKK